MSRRIAFMDLRADWLDDRGAVLRRFEAVLDHGRFVNGPEIFELEQTIGGRLFGAEVVSCASGTVALTMALIALGVGPGDEVIVPAYTFAAPAEAAMLLGAVPVLADVEVPTGLMTAEAAFAAASGRARAAIAVSLYGAAAPVGEIAAALGPNIPVIEDAAQSFGAAPRGSQPRLACHSFFPTKTLGGAGDGGAVSTFDGDLARRLRKIRDHGQSARYRHDLQGLNGRMSSLAAAALLQRLEGFDVALDRRRTVARRYDVAFAPLAADGRLRLATPVGNQTSARGLYAILVDRRDEFASKLEAHGVETAIHYPSALHHQPALKAALTSPALSGAEEMARCAICLPLYPSLSNEAQERVIEAVAAALK